MNFFMEVAKLRAARLIWAKLVKDFGRKREVAAAAHPLPDHRGWSLTAQDVFNNVPRTMIEAMAATQGHTQSLHTNALDEALALPTDFSARIARNTQILLQQESGTTRIIDPWGGSYYVERLTADLAAKAWAHIQEVEALGGMAKAIEAGIPKLRIEEAAAKTQARIDGGRAGDHRRQQASSPTTRPTIDVLQGRQRLGACAAARQAAAPARPSATRRTVQARAGRADERAPPATATCSISRSRRRAPRRPSARSRMAMEARSSGVTAPRSSRSRASTSGRSGTMNAGGRPRADDDPQAFEEADGRRPRILVAKMGQDGHDRGQKVIASAFADLGFDVDIGPLFATPTEAARQAVENDVHIVGVSSLAAGHLTLVPELKAALLPRPDGRDIMIVVGGVIPPQDFPARATTQAPARSSRRAPSSQTPPRRLLEDLNGRLGYASALAQPNRKGSEA